MKMSEVRTYAQYHAPASDKLIRRKINAVHISKANSLKHEVHKLITCYELLKKGHCFITEAVRNTKDQNNKYRRVDIVDLTDALEIEIETTPKRAERFKNEDGVIVVKTWEKEVQI
jgi:hypothetical protein